MNDKTRIRIAVPAHLYESVKQQLTRKESKKRIVETITATEEELKDFYLRVKQIEAEGTDIDSAIQYALFDMNNPNGIEETSLREAKQNYGSGYMPVKEKKNSTSTKPKKEGFEDNIGYKAGEQSPSGDQDSEMTMEKRMAKMEKAIMEMHKEMMANKPVEEEKKSDSEEEEA